MVITRRQEMLGEKLLKAGLIKKEQLEEALSQQKMTKEKVGEILVRLGYISIDEILPLLASHLGVKSTRIELEELDEDLKDVLPLDLMRKHHIFPIRKRGNKLILAMANPNDLFVADDVQLRTKSVVIPVLALKSEIESAIDHISQREEKSSEEQMSDDILNELEGFESTDLEFVEDKDENLEDSLNSDSAPIVKAVNALIAKAIAVGASDIHIEPYEKKVRVRFRIDGVLSEIKSFPKRVIGPMASRIKITSGLDIAEKRLPQDGRFKTTTRGRSIDFRVSTLPTVHGEKIVMRILDKGNLKLNMEDLGFEKEELERFDKALSNPYGMILVTGPTGSGKSTTLYSALNRLNKPDVNISTAEDPVEFQLEGINQVHCKKEIGLDFASALKSFLRQDPDIIMVGEIRDKETAEISVKAALTGHLVLSTIHTNDAPSTIQRLTNMGMEPFMLSSSLLLIEAQRLGRRICSNCKTEVKAKKGQIVALGLDYEEYKDVVFYKGTGCPKCNGTGYKGRVGFYEVMYIDEDIREAIAKGASSDELRKLARKNGMRTLREQAIIKAKNGVTTIEEVLRVTME
ncbi:type IV-A pilus assembly ATPase PilB [Haliovirga abyssi]|uniref:Type IV-A pilus assembly ATPase PilB n=1 Tax=Haliovirga abyssi TaxID=2996794 RepID=A0AAU9DWF5_9FUSO|nr:type IV-A pilus assembly ATPase PilB [Haliovirga abyssi]BDU49565.1 type IV-A pilus assembly ATPase PilB [Haliovirga abyssi]